MISSPTYKIFFIVFLLLFLSSCSTLKPIEAQNSKGYLLAPTNTYVVTSGEPKLDYRFIFKFGIQNTKTQDISHFKVRGDMPEHAVVKALNPGNYRLYSHERRYKRGGGDGVTLLPSKNYPRYEPFEFEIVQGQISVLPWYFGIKKYAVENSNIDSEGAVSEMLSKEDLCIDLEDENRTFIQIWQNEIEHFEEYLNEDRVFYTHQNKPLRSC